MKGHNQFVFIKPFQNAPVAGITWETLIDLAPLVKKDVAKALTRRQFVSYPVRILDHMEGIGSVEIRRALPEGLSPVVNFHTYGTVRSAGDISEDGTNSLGTILIDGGSVMSVMPLYPAKRLNLNLVFTTGLGIRTATAYVTRIYWQCLLDITIAGVTATATVYCIPKPSRPSYTLILGRKRLAQCKAVVQYETDTYTIKDSDDNPFLVPVHGMPSNTVRPPETIMHNPSASNPDE